MSAESATPSTPDAELALAAARTHTGATVAELSRRSAILLVFLRNTGCTFCREALADLSRQHASMAATGTRLALVHLEDATFFATFADRYGLCDVPRVADPDRALYRALGLRRATFLDLLNPRLWWRGWQAAIFRRHGFSAPRGDVAQLAGVFLIRDGRVAAAQVHGSPADRPDYLGICQLQPRAS